MVPQASAAAGSEFAGGWGRQLEMVDWQSDKQKADPVDGERETTMVGISVAVRVARSRRLGAAVLSSAGGIVGPSSSPNHRYLSYYSVSKPYLINSINAPSIVSTASNIPSWQQFFNRNLSSSTSSGQLKTVLIESEDQFNASLRKVQDESLPAIFYFTAVWCGPCKLLSPILVQLTDKYPNVTTYKIDIDQPTLHFYNHGNKVAEIVGADLQLLKDTLEANYK